MVWFAGGVASLWCWLGCLYRGAIDGGVDSERRGRVLIALFVWVAVLRFGAVVGDVRVMASLAVSRVAPVSRDTIGGSVVVWIVWCWSLVAAAVMFGCITMGVDISSDAGGAVSSVVVVAGRVVLSSSGKRGGTWTPSPLQA